MKTVFANILAISMISATTVLAVEKVPAVKTTLTAQQPARPKQTEAEKENSVAIRILDAVLNQIEFARVDFDISISSKSKVVDGKEVSDFAIKLLEVNALTKFKNQVAYHFVEQNKINPNLKEVAPYIVFLTNQMVVVGKASIGNQGKLTLRFCQSYSVNNDFCNTFEDKTLLRVAVKNTSFGAFFELQLKDITLDFEPRLKNGKSKFSGNCTAFKNAFDAVAVTPVLKPAQCVFSGDYDSSRKQKFNFDFTFKTKTQ